MASSPDTRLYTDPDTPGPVTEVSPVGASTLPGLAFPQPHDPRPHLGNYDLVAKLGQGGMAEVYLAISRGSVSDFHKLVVLKRLHTSLQEDGGLVDMFLREASLAARLNHPNVVNTFSVDSDGEHHFIVMEYLEGVPLSELIATYRRRPLPERWPLISAVSQALAGLHYVHEFADYDGTRLQLVHRDIKPSNIFVTFSGQVKILDFGIAKAMSGGGDATASMALKGTARYMSPEAVSEAKNIDRRSDIFSMGVVLWELATGEVPWDGLDNLRILLRLADGDVPSSAALERVPATLARVCERALAPDRERRFLTAASLKHELDTLLHAHGVISGTEALALLTRERFAEVRDQRASAIRARLSDLESLEPLPRLPAFSIGPDPSTGTRRSRSSASMDEAAAPVVPPRRHLAVFLGGAAIAAAVIWGVFWLRWVPVGDPMPAPPAQVAVPTPVDPAISSPTETDRVVPAGISQQAQSPDFPPPPPDHALRVELQASATPSSATLYLDGEALDGNPVRLTLPRDDKVHALEARAPGHTTVSSEVTADRDRVVALSLPRASQRARPRPNPARRSTLPRPSSDRAHPPEPSGSPPNATPPTFGDLPDRPASSSTRKNTLQPDEAPPWAASR